jgi:hypothetical protein
VTKQQNGLIFIKLRPTASESILVGPKREEDGSWRKLNNDELHDLYSSPCIVRVIK